MIFLMSILMAIMTIGIATRKQILPVFITALIGITTFGLFKLAYPNLYYWNISEYDNPNMWDSISLKYWLVWLLLAGANYFIIYKALNYYIRLFCDSVFYNFLLRIINSMKENTIKYEKFKQTYFAKFIKGYEIGEKFRFKKHSENINDNENDAIKEMSNEARQHIVITINIIVCGLLFIKYDAAIPVIIGAVLYLAFTILLIRTVYVFYILVADDKIEVVEKEKQSLN